MIDNISLLAQEMENQINILGDKIRGTIFNNDELEYIQNEIQSNFVNDNIDEHFKGEKNDIRMQIFNYEYPIAEKTINNITIKICQGLTRNKENTYLLYLDRVILGEFFSVEDIKLIIKNTEISLNKRK